MRTETALSSGLHGNGDMLSVKDIPEPMMAQIRLTFDSDPQVVNLRIQQDLMKRQGNFRGALEIAKQIEDLYSKVVQAYLELTEQEAERFDLNTCGIPPSDIEKINELAVTLFMACDIIESCILDTNDIIHRTDKDMSFEMFNDIKQLSDMVKAKLKFLQANSEYAKDMFWADKCDNMYELMKNKARSIIRKRKNDPNWGG